MKDLYVDCDVLVVGGGIAGVAAACKARELGCDVVLVDKAQLGRGGCTPLASGVFHYYTATDDMDVVIRGLSNPLTNHRLLRDHVLQTHEALKFLEQAGVRFIKDGEQIIRVGGPRVPFPHSAMMAGGGPQMGLALRAETLRRGVRVFNRVMVTGLLTSDGQQPTAGRVIGATGFHTRSAQYHVFRAKTVIIASGPFGIPFNRYDSSFSTRTMPIDASGEAINAMYQAGAVMGKLEMGFRAPHPPEFTNAPAMEMLTAIGDSSVWMNAQGDRFLSPEFRSHLFGRSSVTVAVMREYTAGRGPVGINISHFNPEQRRLLAQVVPIVVRNYESAGYDLTRDTVPYTPGAPVGSGVNGAGARINERGETSIPGLYAAGNCCDGAYICLGQTLDMCAVTGWWAGQSAADYLRAAAACPAPDPDQVAQYKREFLAPLERASGRSFAQVRDALSDIQVSLTPTLNHRNMTAARGRLQQLMAEDLPNLVARDGRELSRVASLRYSAPILDLVLTVMAHRTESRGNIIRDDCPYTDNIDWLKHTVVQRQAADDFQLWDIPVSEDDWLLPPARQRTLHPFFVEAVR